MHFHFSRGCGSRGRGDRWEHFATRFAARFDEAQGLGRGSSGRGRRMFDGGELRLVLLKLIADEPRHGYDLIREIEELTGGAYAPSPGVVYPTLALLDEMGLIEEQRSEGAKKRFASTEEGRKHLDEKRAEADALIARLTELGAHRQRSDRGPVRRAMGNLGQAVGNRVSRGDWSDDTLHDIAALIDEVAQKIERLR
ncbi:MAG: PadR family transcriptional regulator [Sphingomonas bacterium]|uniref:PadR family transcriptional regulator n=1 Tax=Sphingomonas bacterium TaxID=1895847 RepID=UPI002610255C|nr:PadR family transcriptional regulator [Sphingomonas bacterium]MDB5695745.1 PadR family transcriptional regulator [Sphingomonas bacterium]